MPFGAHGFKNFQAAIQRFAKALFFGSDDPRDVVALVCHFGICRAHFPGNGFDQLIDEWLAHVQRASKPRGAAQNAAQNIAPALVGGQRAICDRKGEGADVIREHAHGHDMVAAIGFAGDLADGCEDGQKDVRIVRAFRALQNRANALEPHARIHVLIGQRL